MNNPPDGERTLIAWYLDQIRRYPRLGREAERRLVRAIRQDRPDAVNELIEANLGFVVKVATEYRSSGLSLEDLINEGNLGLIEAARRFDPGKDTKFITYAIWWIRKMILRALTQKSRVVRIPEVQLKKLWEYRATEADLRRSLGRRPTREEISENLARSPAALDELFGYPLDKTSLDQPRGERGETPLADTLREERIGAEDGLLRGEMRREAADAFRRLRPQSQIVLALRLGLDGEPPQTLAQVGSRLGLSRERIRQIEAEAKKRLLRMLTARRRDAPVKPPRGSIPMRRDRRADD